MLSCVTGMNQEEGDLTGRIRNNCCSGRGLSDYRGITQTSRVLFSRHIIRVLCSKTITSRCLEHPKSVQKSNTAAFCLRCNRHACRDAASYSLLCATVPLSTLYTVLVICLLTCKVEVLCVTRHVLY